MYKLILGNKNYSSWSMRPWLALKKTNIEFEEVVIPLYQENSKSNLSVYSASGKVPVLVTEEVTICDSLAICEYVAEIEPALWPANQNSRALARSISSEMHSGFELIRGMLPMNCRAENRNVDMTDSLKQQINRVETIWTQCNESFAQGGPWLFGQFSIADTMFAPVVSRFKTYGISLNRPCNAYMDHVLSDEHVQQWYAAGALETHVIQASEVGNSNQE